MSGASPQALPQAVPPEALAAVQELAAASASAASADPLLDSLFQSLGGGE
jgi:hypothetical protein